MSSSGVPCFTPLHVCYDCRKCSRAQIHLAASVASPGYVSEPYYPTSRRYPLRRCDCYDLHKKLVPYHDAWLWQKSIVETRKALLERDEDDSDLVIILQHPPVFTLGTRSSEEYLKFNLEDPPCDVHRTDRGGEVTYHGPGQLVMYPIINLRHHKMDLHWYLRSLEEVIIRVLSSFSVKASRMDGLTGVWVGNQKVAAIGVHVSKWITYHGVALNVTTDLEAFKHIVPCGISNRDVGSLLEILGGSAQTDPHELIDITHESLLAEFAEVFELGLETNATDIAVSCGEGLVKPSH